MATAQIRFSNESLFRPDQLPAPPPGHVWVEWVGEASPLDDPVVGFNLITNRYTEEQKAVIRGLCQHRVARVHKHTRTIRQGDAPGISQDWRFGDDQRARPGHPKSFCQALPFRDADAIKASKYGHQFIIHAERDGEAVNTISVPRNGQVTLVTEESYRDLGGFKRAMGW